MVSWVNYHSHTHYCDGTDYPDAYAKEAVRLGLPAYGYSSHAPVPFASNWNIPEEKLGSYLSEVTRIKKEYNPVLQIYVGLEIDFIPGIAGRTQHFLKNTGLDYFIGSVHFVEQFADGEHWNIDTSGELFKKGLKEIFGNDFRKAAIRFWEITRQMVEEDRPDIIGHLDKIKMFNTKFHFFRETEKWYRDQVELTLATISKHNCIVEINTRGYYRYGQPDLYPAEWIVKRLAEYNIPVTLSSDAHKPGEIISGMAFAAGKLKKLCIARLAALYNNKWIEYPFNERGIQL